MNCKRTASLLVAAGLLLVYNGTALAAPAAPPKITARSAIVIEQGSRRVLFEKNAHERLAMASTTKIMTALVALEHGSLDDVVTVSARAAGIPGSSIYLKAGEQLTLGQLLYGLMLQSGNDASVAIAEHVGGTVDGFLTMMNDRAASLGLVDTHFASPNGLDTPEHYTSAYDLAMITAAAMDNPDFCKIVATKGIYMPLQGLENGRYVKNKNSLLWSYGGANGVKTGYTGNAGRCYVGSAMREGMQLISVVLNCGPMFEEAAAMMDTAFADYDMVTMVEPHLAYGAIKTDEGIAGAVHYGVPQPVVLPLTAAERASVRMTIELPAAADAPVAKGQVLGQGTVALDGQELAAFPVIALEEDGRRTFFWYVNRIIEGFKWTGNGEKPGFRSILPFVGSPRAGSARS